MSKSKPTPDADPERVVFLFDDEDAFFEGEVVDSEPLGGYNRDPDEMLWVHVPGRGTYRRRRSRTLPA